MQIYLQICEPASNSALDELINIKGLQRLTENEAPGAGVEGLILRSDATGLSLLAGEDSRTGATRVDFLDAGLRYRLKTSKKSEGLPKAVGLDKAQGGLTVLDCTAGLGIDAFILAAMGCRVTLLEKDPVMGALLQDGLYRAHNQGDAGIVSAIDNMTFSAVDAHDYLSSLSAMTAEAPDVITLDPMFPSRQKSAKVKKDMALMQRFLPPNEDVESLLEKALETAGKRVVLKRPGKVGKKPDNKALSGAGRKPDFQVPGKACHFQVFLTG